MRRVVLLAVACLVACSDVDGGARDGAVVMDQAVVVDAAADQAGGEDLTQADDDDDEEEEEEEEDDLTAGPLDDLTSAPPDDLTSAPPDDLTGAPLDDLTPACASPCAFGCDTTSGTCRDLVPANQAAAHLDTSGTAGVLPAPARPTRRYLT